MFTLVRIGFGLPADLQGRWCGVRVGARVRACLPFRYALHRCICVGPHVHIYSNRSIPYHVLHIYSSASRLHSYSSRRTPLLGLHRYSLLHVYSFRYSHSAPTQIQRWNCFTPFQAVPHPHTHTAPPPL